MYNFHQHRLYFFEEKKPKKAKSEKKENALATARSKVNEIHLAYVLNREKHVSPEAEKEFKKNAALLSPEERNNQMRRAEAMARSYLDVAKRHHGFTGNIEDIASVHLTGSGGGIKKVGREHKQPHLEEIQSQDHPADVLVRWNHRSRVHGTEFHGLSAKSNEGKGLERISNRGIDGISRQLTEAHPKGKKIDTHSHHDRAMEEFAKKHGMLHLPLKIAGPDKNHPKKSRYGIIKSNKKIMADAEKAGARSQKKARDAYVAGMEELHSQDIDAVKRHLLQHHMRVGSRQARALPYVVVSGYGNNQAGYGAAVHNPEHSVHSRLVINAHGFTIEHSGDTGFRVHAHGPGYEDGAHVLTVQLKHNTQKMAGKMKAIATEGSLRMKTKKQAPNWEETLPVDKPTAVGKKFLKKLDDETKNEKKKSNKKGKK